MSFRSTLVLSSGYETQTYDDQVALDAGGLPVSDLAIRLDKITFGEISLDVPLGNRFELGVDYRIERSLSNDVFYDYDGRRAVSVTFGLEF